MKDCIFCKISNREIPKEFTYEDKDVMVFPDIHPRKPVHLLIVSKKHIKEFAAIKDLDLLKDMGKVIQEMIKKFGLDIKGHRLVINGGGAQLVDHLHIHIMGPIGKTE